MPSSLPSLGFRKLFLRLGSRDFILGIQIRSLSNDEGDGNEDGKKAIGLDWQNVHHAFVYISLPSMHDYDLRRPYFTFHVSLFLFLNFSAVFQNATPEKLSSI